MSTSQFRLKADKKPVPHDKRMTLDAFHTNKMSEFRKARNGLSEKQQQLTQLQGRLKELPAAKRRSIEYRALQSQIEAVEKQIQEIESDNKVVQYFLNVGDLLFQYYDYRGKIAAGEKPDVEPNPAHKTRDTDTILSFFSNCDEDATATVATATTVADKEEEYDEDEEVISASHMDILHLPKLGPDRLLHRYLNIVDPNHHECTPPPGHEDTVTFDECPHCESEMMISPNDAKVYCPNPTCGFSDYILLDSDKPSYKEPRPEVSYFAYKRINHFNEWLSQFQAKESTEIPADVYERILAELKTQGIHSMAALRTNKMREILRKLRLNRFYEHVPHIINRLNGLPAPVMSREVEERLRFMFREIQPPFIRHCPADRSNFLSYSYVLYKFCELLGLDEYLPCFPLLKSREKLHAQDRIWQKICSDLRWEFIRSV
jgi:chaperonin cofactor prefoldin